MVSTYNASVTVGDYSATPIDGFVVTITVIDDDSYDDDSADDDLSDNDVDDDLDDSGDDNGNGGDDTKDNSGGGCTD